MPIILKLEKFNKIKPILISFFTMFMTSSCTLIPAQCVDDLQLDTSDLGEIKRYQSCEATISGVIYSTHITNSEKVLYLNLGNANYKESFTVVIFAKDIKKFAGEPFFADTLFRLKDKFTRQPTVTVYGLIGDYKGKPQMIINSPKQITIFSTSN